MISIPLESGVTEYLATTVFDESITAVDFKELYFLRWSLESKYAELKNQFLLEEFSGATSTSIEQEFYINLLLSNMVSMIKSSADKEIEKTARPNNKYRYQANRAFIIARVKWFLSRYLSSDITIALLTEIYSDACVNRGGQKVFFCRSVLTPAQMPAGITDRKLVSADKNNPRKMTVTFGVFIMSRISF